MRARGYLGEKTKKYKSITVNESTFEAIDRLSTILLPEIKLSKAKVIELLVKRKNEIK